MKKSKVELNPYYSIFCHDGMKIEVRPNGCLQIYEDKNVWDDDAYPVWEFKVHVSLGPHGAEQLQALMNMFAPEIRKEWDAMVKAHSKKTKKKTTKKKAVKKKVAKKKTTKKAKGKTSAKDS